MVTHELNCKYCDTPFIRTTSGNKAPPKYCKHECYGLDKRYPFILKNGYRMVIEKGHPRANDHGYVREHILVMEKKLGRYISKEESVHHIDGNKQNNHPDNLGVFSSHTEHLEHHWKENSLRKTNCGEHRSSD